MHLSLWTSAMYTHYDSSHLWRVCVWLTALLIVLCISSEYSIVWSCKHALFVRSWIWTDLRKMVLKLSLFKMHCLVPQRWLWREQSNLLQCPYSGLSELNQVYHWQSVRCESVNCGNSLTFRGEEIRWHLAMPQYDGCGFSCAIPDRLSLSLTCLSLSAERVRGDAQECYAAWLSQVVSWLVLEGIYLLKANCIRVFFLNLCSCVWD